MKESLNHLSKTKKQSINHAEGSPIASKEVETCSKFLRGEVQPDIDGVAVSYKDEHL